MIGNETDIIDSIDEAQVRFLKANEAGMELGRNGEMYVSPFEAIPEICSDPKNKLDRFVAFHYDRGYLTAYGHYLAANPGAVEDLSYRRLVKKYCLVDKAQSLGIAAYREGRSSDDVVAEVYEMLSESQSDINLSLYDGWEFGYVLGLVYGKDYPKMNQHTEIALLDAATEKMNEYVRALVRNKKVKEADSYCDEKYAQIAATGFFKKILAYFTDRGADDDVCEGADLAGVYEFVSAQLPDRAKLERNTAAGKSSCTGEGLCTGKNNSIGKNDGTGENDGIGENDGTGEGGGAGDGYISIDVGEKVTLQLRISGPEALAATVCVPPSEVWNIPVENEEKSTQPDNMQIQELDGQEEKAPLIFPVRRVAAFCKAAEHIYKNAHRLNEWTKLRCWRLAEKYEYLDYPKEAVLAEVPEVWWDDWLAEASDKDKSDLVFVRKLISGRGECLKHAPEILKSDRKTVLKAIKDFSYSINYAAEELQNDKSFILEGIKKNGQLFEDIDESFRDDREIAVAAIKKRAYNYEYASDRLKRDREIIETVMADNIYYLRYAPADVLEDKDLVMRIVSERGDMLQYLPAGMRADKDVVLTAVGSRGACAAEEYGLGGIALSYALGDLNNDREVVLAAVGYCGLALMCASDELKDDRDIVRVAVENYGRALQSASVRLQDDREIVYEAIRNDGTAFFFASERLRHDREIIMAAFQSAGIEIIDSIPEDLFCDIDFRILMLEAIARGLPKFEDYGEFGDGTSDYYGIFEDYEEAFSDIVESIPAEQLRAEPELAEKIWKLAEDVDKAYYDEGSNPYEDSHERLPVILREYFEKNDIPLS